MVFYYRGMTDFSNANIVIDGNSLFAAFYGSMGVGTRPTLNGQAATQTNVAISSQTWRNMNGLTESVGGIASPSATDVDGAYSAGKTNILILWEDTNAVFGAGRTAAQVIQDQQDYIAERKAAHPDWKIILLGSIPRQSTNKTLQANGNATLDTIREWQRGNYRKMGVAHYVDPRFGNSPYNLPDYTDASFASIDPYWYPNDVAAGERVHISADKGAAVIGGLIDRALRRLKK